MRARRAGGLLLAGLVVGLLVVLLSVASPARATPLDTGLSARLDQAAAALATNPVYVATGAVPIDVARVRAALPAQLYVVVFPPLTTGTGGTAGTDPAALPAALASRLHRDGTVVVLVGDELEASSTTVPQQLPDELGAAREELHRRSGGGPVTPAAATSALVDLAYVLANPVPIATPTASPTEATRAGGPGDSALLVLVLALLVALAAGLALWLRMLRRRTGRMRRRRRAAVPDRPLTRVEVDAYGHITRIVPPGET